jgi:hypothetical protein
MLALTPDDASLLHKSSCTSVAVQVDFRFGCQSEIIALRSNDVDDLTGHCAYPVSTAASASLGLILVSPWSKRASP